MSIYIYSVIDRQNREVLRTENAIGKAGYEAARDMCRIIGGMILEHEFILNDTQMVEEHEGEIPSDPTEIQ